MSFSGFKDNSPRHESISENSEDNHYEYLNEDYFDNENDDNDEDVVDEGDYDETNTATISDYQDQENNNSNTIYLKSINNSIKLMVERVSELSDNIQSWEEKGNTQLEQFADILRNYKTKSNGQTYKSKKFAKRKRLSESDDAIEDITNFDEEIPNDYMEEDETNTHVMKSNTLQRNKLILDDYLKTKQLERDFMTEKHKLQMEILKLELEIKRNEFLKDA